MPFLGDLTLMKKDVGSNRLDFIYLGERVGSEEGRRGGECDEFEWGFIGGGTKVDSERA